MDDHLLETRLEALGRHVEWPETPDIASAVTAELTRRAPWLKRVLAAAAVLLIAMTGVLVALPEARHAVARWIGVPGISVRTVEEAPTVPSPSGDRSLADRYRLGEPVSLTEAGERAAFRVLVPEGSVHALTDVFFDASVLGGAVTFLYAPDQHLPSAAEEDVGALFTQFQGDIDRPEFGKKLAMSGTRLRAVEVGGAPGLFLSGAPHIIFYMGPDGEVARDTARLAANTLIWSDNGITYRFESSLDLEAALAFVENLKPL